MINDSCIKELQNELKKEWLLLERQQKQKNRMLKEIDDKVKSYFEIWLQSDMQSQITQRDNLGDCYNYVKDLILEICKDVELGFKILSKGSDEFLGDLVRIFVNILYENFCENDPYYKNTTKFICYVVKEISSYIREGIDRQCELAQNLIPKILWDALKQFLKKNQNKAYFEMKSNKVLSMVPVCLHRVQSQVDMRSPFNSYNSCIEVKEEDMIANIELKPLNSSYLQFVKSFNSDSEKDIESQMKYIVDQFVKDICESAEFFPINIKIILRMFKEQLKGCPQAKVDKFLWQILMEEFLRPLSNSDTRDWNHFRNSQFSESLKSICSLTKSAFDKNMIKKLIQRGSIVEQKKYSNRFNEQSERQNKIVVFGVCLTYKQLYYIIKTIKSNEKEIKCLSERVVNRTKRILEINPDMFIFTDAPNAATTYVVFKELKYGKTIQNDYVKMYNNIYKTDKVKDILKQILTDNNFDLPESIYESSLRDVLQTITKEVNINKTQKEYKNALTVSSQFVMKIKYLMWLLQKKEVNEEKVYGEMIKESRERQNKNLELYVQTKNKILRTLTHIHQVTRSLESEQLSKKKIAEHLQAVQNLDKVQLNLCISSPSNRPEKTQFTKAKGGKIICEGAEKCVHQDNIIPGLNTHASNVMEAIERFAKLKEVEQAIQTGRDRVGVHEGLIQIFQTIKNACQEKRNLTIKQLEQFEQSSSLVIMRTLHQILIQRRNPSVADQDFVSKLKSLSSFIQPKNIKVDANKTFSDSEQLWQITSRYLQTLLEKKTPEQKIDLLKEIFRIMKMSVEIHFHDENLKVQSLMKIMIAYCLIRAKPEKFISTIHFIQLFIGKEKLLSTEGKILSQIRQAIDLIDENKIFQFLTGIDHDFYDQEYDRASIANNMVQMKKRQSCKVPFL